MSENLLSTTLVTGGTGFIGTHLIKRLLSESVRVRVLVRPNSLRASELTGLDVDIVNGDLRNAETLNEAARGIKTIYHLGAVHTGEEPSQIYQTNIQGTKYLIRAAVAQGVERFVLISDIEVYDLVNVKKGTKVTEDSPCLVNPLRIGAYAHSRIEMERLIFDAYHDHNLKVTVTRLGIVVGSMGTIFFPHLGYRYQNRIFFPIGRGDRILPLTYVENTVDGIYRASVNDQAIGQIYNLVENGEITVTEYLEQFIRVVGIKARIFYLPYVLPYFATTAYELAARLGLLKKDVTSRFRFRWKHTPVRFDNSKARNELGWKSRVSIRKGLSKTFEWYANQHKRVTAKSNVESVVYSDRER